MRYSLPVLLLLVANTVYSADSITSYQEALDSYMQESKTSGSPFTAEDQAVMERAAESLARSMPDPGIMPGEHAPMFSLTVAFGVKVNLKDELDKGPVVLVFYRGAWCPFCNLHLHALQKIEPKLLQLGATLLAITPQTPDKSAGQIKKYG